MKRAHRLLCRCISLILVSITTLGVFLPQTALAAESTGNTATDRGGSMIDFFRTQNTSMDFTTITNDDLYVYGVFLSNFFIPGETKLGDLKLIGDDNKDSKDMHNLTAIMSQRFFGSVDTAYTDVGKLNGNVYSMITGKSGKGNGFGSGSGGGYYRLSTDPTVATNSSASSLTGVELLHAIANGALGEPGSTIYTRGTSDAQNAKGLLDFSVPAWQAAWKIILNSNSTFFSAQGGVVWKDMKAIYMDGFGNFWYTTDFGSNNDELTLLFPACLNPIRHNYAKEIKSKDDLRLPIANAFVMGNFLQINDNNMTFREEWRDAQTNEVQSSLPLFNLIRTELNNISTGKSRIQIFGVDSPLYGLGNTNDVFEHTDSGMITGLKINKSAADIGKSISEFVGTTGDGDITKETNSGIFIATTYLGGEGKDEVSRFLTKDNLGDDLVNSTLGAGLVSVLFDALFISNEDFDDTMYYMNFNNINLQSSSAVQVNEWTSDNFANFGVPSQRMFYQDSSLSSATSGASHYIEGSYLHSPALTYYYDTYENSKNAARAKIDAWNAKNLVSVGEIKNFPDTCPYGWCIGETIGTTGVSTMGPVSGLVRTMCDEISNTSGEIFNWNRNPDEHTYAGFTVNPDVVYALWQVFGDTYKQVPHDLVGAGADPDFINTDEYPNLYELIEKIQYWVNHSMNMEYLDWIAHDGDSFYTIRELLRQCIEPFTPAEGRGLSFDEVADRYIPKGSTPHLISFLCGRDPYKPAGWQNATDTLSFGTINWVKPDGFAMWGFLNAWLTAAENRYYLVFGMSAKDSCAKTTLVNRGDAEAGAPYIPGDPVADSYFTTLYTLYTLFGANSFLLNAVQSDMTKAGDTIEGANGTMNINIANKVNMWPGIFWSYMRTMLNIRTEKKTVNGVEQDMLNASHTYNGDLPPMAQLGTSGSIDLGDVFAQSGTATDSKKSMQEMQEDIVKKVYGLLSETDNTYRNTLIKATTDGWVVSTHRAITGAWANGVASVSTGTSNYQGVVGYINTPTLRDIPLTSWVMENYMLLYVFLLIIVIIVLILMFLLNLRTLKQCLGAFAVLCVALMLPNILINGVINITNSTADSIYSERFNYWALVQHMQSVKNMSDAENTDNTMNVIIAQNAEAARNVYSTDAGVRVKWMAPKRDGTFANLFTSANRNEGMSTNLTLFRWLFSSFIYQEEFVYTGDKLVTYLYRPYNAVANEAIALYKKLNEQWPDPAALRGTDGVYSANSYIYEQSTTVPLIPDTVRFKKFINTYETYTDPTEGYTLQYSPMQFLTLQHNRLYVQNKLSNVYDEAIMRSEYDTELQRLLLPALWCLQSETVTDAIFQPSIDLNSCGLDISTQTSDLGMETYLRYSESPFYYFYNVLKSNYGTNFPKALLNADVFRQSRTLLPESIADSGGKTKDFLDLENLFTYVIPYLGAGNDYVIKWTNTYGMDVSTYDFAGGTAGLDPADPRVADYTAAEAKKSSLEKVWNMYSPWVDALSELSGHNAKAKIADTTIYIDDPLNPAYYEAQGRPMIFGESDMYMKGYRIKDLTDVEMRIQRVLDATYKDMMYLVNYYDFDDEVLMTAAAMMATFNFNAEFSNPGVLGQGTMLYPQGFEMKNFNYDAFMRLALLNATGESLFSEKDLYVQVMSNTSIFTGIILLANDLVAVIGIPVMKLLVLLFLLFLGLIMCVACVITPPEQMVKSIFKAFAIPCIAFMGASIAFSGLISLVVGEGLTTYVGSKVPSLTINDPSITILIMMVLGAIYMFVLFKILKMIFKSLKTYGMASVFASLGVLAGAGTLLANTALKQGKRVAGKALGVADTVAGGAVGAVAGRVAYGKGGWKDGMYESAESGLSGMYGNYMKHRARKRGADEYADSMHRLSKEDIDKKSTTRGDGTAKKKKEATPAQSETKSYTPPVQKPKEKEVKYKKEEGREFVESKGTADESLHTPESRRETQHKNDTGVVDMSKVRFVPTKERPTTLVVKKKPNRAAKVVVLKPTEKKVQRTDRDYSDGNRN